LRLRPTGPRAGGGSGSQPRDSSDQCSDRPASRRRLPRRGRSSTNGGTRAVRSARAQPSPRPRSRDCG
jgi:hypothetical protein